MQHETGFHYLKNNHVQNVLQQKLQNGLRNKNTIVPNTNIQKVAYKG